MDAADDLERKGPGARLQWGKGKEEPSTRLIPICISHIYSDVKPDHGIVMMILFAVAKAPNEKSPAGEGLGDSSGDRI